MTLVKLLWDFHSSQINCCPSLVKNTWTQKVNQLYYNMDLLKSNLFFGKKGNQRHRTRHRAFKTFEQTFSQLYNCLRLLWRSRAAVRVYSSVHSTSMRIGQSLDEKEQWHSSNIYLPNSMSLGAWSVGFHFAWQIYQLRIPSSHDLHYGGLGATWCANSLS